MYLTLGIPFGNRDPKMLKISLQPSCELSPRRGQMLFDIDGFVWESSQCPVMTGGSKAKEFDNMLTDLAFHQNFLNCFGFPWLNQ